MANDYPSAAATRSIQALLNDVLAISNVLRRHGAVDFPTDLPPGGQDVVALLAGAGPLTVPQIARKRGNSRQNIQVIVNRLRSAGLVRLEPNPDHKRSPRVTQTPKAEALIKELLPAKVARLEKIVGALSPQAIESTAQVLGAIWECLQSANGTGTGSRALRAHTEPQPERQSPPPAEEEVPVSLL